MASITGLDAACARLLARVTRAARVGAEAELMAVVERARADWPRRTGASARQLVARPTAEGADVRLTGYAPDVHRAGSSRPAWRELITDRLSATRAGRRILGALDG